MPPVDHTTSASAMMEDEESIAGRWEEGKELGMELWEKEWNR